MKSKELSGIRPEIMIRATLSEPARLILNYEKILSKHVIKRAVFVPLSNSEIIQALDCRLLLCSCDINSSSPPDF